MISRHHDVNPKVELYWQLDGGVAVSIETERLLLRSTTMNEAPLYEALFAKPDVYTSYGSGLQPELGAWTKRIETIYVGKRLSKGNPLGGLGIWKKDEQNQLAAWIGHVALGYGEEPGEGHLGFALDPKFWGNGYATEAVGAVVYGLGKEVWKSGHDFDGKPLQRISATAFQFNNRSHRVLEKVGLKQTGDYPKGAIDPDKKLYYSVKVEELGFTRDVEGN